MAKEVRQRRSSMEWRELIGVWQRTGQSAEAFASERGLNAKTLCWWASELLRRDRRESRVKNAPAATGAATFLPVRVVDETLGSYVEPHAGAAARAEIVLTNGRLFRVSVGSDEAWIARVAVALDGARAC